MREESLCCRGGYDWWVVTALYRRYRPETFSEMIGQSHVTEPLMTALRADRVNHAYLFSGPRGCGKTTSARILARCLNCAEGPTDTPCGVCASCRELARDGGGSLDVVEIDAASHNGVDDARDLRERAVFAPARDRYKVFILDEAHMVTPQGFNALLKIVEEPPDHVTFIFATTEPDKVIGTIRSRTHHYPFRLIPPSLMVDYVQSLCVSESVDIAPGVVPLVVRSGGGSARDTVSILDQLMAGSARGVISYERAIALLGYTPAALLDEVIDALGARDARSAFGVVDQVIQSGQDPRRFVEDVLERLRDLIVVAATESDASAVLRGVPRDEIDLMATRAASFGDAALSRTADIVNAALTTMTGVTSPKLHLELMIARILVPAIDDTDRGALARVERLERRVGISAGASGDGGRGGGDGALPVRVGHPPESTGASASLSCGDGDSVDVTTAPDVDEPVSLVTVQQVRDAWPQILAVVEKAKRSAWLVIYTARVHELRGDILVLFFASENDVASFKEHGASNGVSEYLRRAIIDVLGVRVKFLAKVDASQSVAGPRESAAAREGEHNTAWATVAIPGSRDESQSSAAISVSSAARQESRDMVRPPRETTARSEARQRYGESVVREILGASFIEEHTITTPSDRSRVE